MQNVPYSPMSGVGAEDQRLQRARPVRLSGICREAPSTSFATAANASSEGVIRRPDFPRVGLGAYLCRDAALRRQHADGRHRGASATLSPAAISNRIHASSTGRATNCLAGRSSVQPPTLQQPTLREVPERRTANPRPPDRATRALLTIPHLRNSARDRHSSNIGRSRRSAPD